MEKKFKHIIITSLLVIVTLHAPQAFAKEGALSLLVDKAINQNPKIQSALHEWKASEYKAKHVRSLPDPMATYGHFGEEMQTRVGPQEYKVGVAQKIPFPGKLGLKGKAAQKHSEMLKEQYEATKNEVIKQVKFVYYDLYWVDRAIQINEEEKLILEKLENVAQRKYESNMIPQQDVVKVQVELSKIIKKLFLLRQNRKALSAQMNSLLNRSLEGDLETVSQIEQQKFDYSLNDVVELAKSSRQELRSANLAVEKQEFQKDLAKMSYLPDFTLGAEYTEIGSGSTTQANDGEDAWMLKFSVNVPLWFGKLNSEIKEKEEELKAAELNKENVENTVLFEVQDLYFKILAYKDIVLLYESALLPQAEQAFDASQIAFETGQVDFLNWLDTERTFLQTRLAYYKSITDYHKSIAFLERVIGQHISEAHHD